MSWHLGRMTAFDLETSGVDVEEDRIVTAAVYGVGGGRPVDPASWMADPGIEIPKAASDIHKVTTEQARAEGRPAREVITEVVERLALLDRECRRHDVAPLTDRIHPDIQLRVIDTYVLDKHVDQFRKKVSDDQGAHVLKTCAATYRLRWDEEAAHACEYDALVAARVAYRIGYLAHTDRTEWPDEIRAVKRPRFHELRDLDLDALHQAQIKWAADQAASYQAYRRKTEPDVVIDGSWPIRPWGDS